MRCVSTKVTALKILEALEKASEQEHYGQTDITFGLKDCVSEGHGKITSFSSTERRKFLT